MEAIGEILAKKKFDNMDDTQKITLLRSRLEPLPIKELMIKDFPDQEWVVERLIPYPGITAISGAPASFKTWIALEIALKVAQGQKVFGQFSTQQAGVLIVDEESSERSLQKRIGKLTSSFDIPVYCLSFSGFKLNPNPVRVLIEKAILLGCKLIIFDSFLRIHDMDENDAKQMAKISDQMKEFKKNGLAVAFIHHHRKQGANSNINLLQEMRGSSDIGAQIDGHLAIVRKDDHFVVHQTKLREGEELKPFQVNIMTNQNPWQFEYADIAIPDKQEDARIAITDILAQRGQLNIKEIYTELNATKIGIGYKKVREIIEKMATDNEVVMTRGSQNQIVCSLPTEDSVSAAE